MILDVIVISPPSGGRSHALLQRLKSNSDLRISLLPATMIPNAEVLRCYSSAINESKIRAVHGRMLSGPEIGCTISHNHARELVSEMDLGGVILEDDARIENVSKFYEICSNFLVRERGRASLLNLVCDDTRNTSRTGRGYRRRLNPSPLAVGYLLTPSAASLLYRVNTPVSYMGDWPPARLRFFTVTEEVVIHGDPDTVSFLGSASQRKHIKGLGFEVLSLWHYFRNRREFLGFKDWTMTMFLPRILHHIDFALMNALSLAKSFLTRN